ncbi:hypothetical protein ACIGW3_31895 [Streptomyces sp. NPDC053499]|uniref:hypothetical protein n=1 Tax=Streptomyces sp. NPDC053499 TaxID=3365707 RepID=UPI0037D87721
MGIDMEPLVRRFQTDYPGLSTRTARICVEHLTELCIRHGRAKGISAFEQLVDAAARERRAWAIELTDHGLWAKPKTKTSSRAGDRGRAAPRQPVCRGSREVRGA